MVGTTQLFLLESEEMDFLSLCGSVTSSRPLLGWKMKSSRWGGSCQLRTILWRKEQLRAIALMTQWPWGKKPWLVSGKCWDSNSAHYDFVGCKIFKYPFKGKSLYIANSIHIRWKRLKWGTWKNYGFHQFREKQQEHKRRDRWGHKKDFHNFMICHRKFALFEGSMWRNYSMF